LVTLDCPGSGVRGPESGGRCRKCNRPGNRSTQNLRSR
jgi:hypothetical protein